MKGVIKKIISLVMCLLFALSYDVFARVYEHSDVLLSSRTYHEPGWSSIELSTLDAMQRYAANHNAWSYSYAPADIHAVQSVGGKVQGTVNMGQGDSRTALKTIEGNDGYPSWIPGMVLWGCLNNPEYYALIMSKVKTMVDNGVTIIQFDDFGGNKSAAVRSDAHLGGCFCDYCMQDFRDYVRDNCTPQEIAAYGIADISDFNFKIYLAAKGVDTVEEFNAYKSDGGALTNEFVSFNEKVTRSFHQRWTAEIKEYGRNRGKNILCSSNDSFNMFFWNFNAMFCYDIFDFSMAEETLSMLNTPNMAASAAMAAAFGKENVISPAFYDYTTMDEIRDSIPSAYAFGHQYIIPWDTNIWDGGGSRYYGKPEDFASLFHFVREYPYLFDGYEMNPKIGLLFKWNTANHSQLLTYADSLLKQGVPFKFVAANDLEYPALDFTAEDLTGLEKLYCINRLSEFSSVQQTAIAQSGVSVQSVSQMITSALAGYTVAKTEDSGVYTSVRENTAAESKVIHILNRNIGQELSDVSISVNGDDFYDMSEVQTTLYSPNSSPENIIFQSAENGMYTANISKLSEWAIIRISCNMREYFEVPQSYNGMTVGNPAAQGSSSINETRLILSSNATGLGRARNAEGGESDAFSMVYKKGGGNTVTAYLEQVDGGSGASTGVMLRDTIASNSPFVSLGYEVGRGLVLYDRNEYNTQIQAVVIDNIALPVHLRLSLEDGIVTAYLSNDGLDWKEAASLTISFSGIIKALYATGDYYETNTETSFDLDLPSRLIEVGDIAVTGIMANASAQAVVEFNNTSDITLNAVLTIEAIDGEIVIASVKKKVRISAGVSSSLAMGAKMPDNIENVCFRAYAANSLNTNLASRISDEAIWTQ